MLIAKLTNRLIVLGCMLLSVQSTCFGQNCECTTLAQKTINLVKKKYVGFKYKSNSRQYSEKEQNLLRLAAKISKKNCGNLIFDYLMFFRDKHIWFSEDISDLDYRGLSKHLSNLEINKQRIDTLQGLWTSDFKLYTLLFIRENDRLKGYVVDAKTDGYKKGDLKMEIFLPATDIAASINYERWNGVWEKQYKICNISSSKIITDIFKYTRTSPDSLTQYAKLPPQYPNFEPNISVVPNAIILTIPSSAYGYHKKIDTLLARHDSVIRKTENLIIDLRNNAGGNTYLSTPLLQYMYTQPYKIFGACNLAIEETVASYKKVLMDTIGNTKEELLSYELQLKMLQQSLGKVVCDTVEIKEFAEVLPYPKNVAILMNNLTLSAAELSILVAKQSKKVKLFGEYSGGTVDFGAALEYNIGCKKYELSLPMQTNTDYPVKKYDIVGIKPDVHISEKITNWVQFVVNYYNGKY